MADTANGRKKGPAAEKRIITAIRIPPSVLKEIDERAQSYRMTRTEYMIRAALGETMNPGGLQGQLDTHEERIARLEELAYGS